jgi:hypothetical protein
MAWHHAQRRLQVKGSNHASGKTSLGKSIGLGGSNRSLDCIVHLYTFARWRAWPCVGAKIADRAGLLPALSALGGKNE